MRPELWVCTGALITAAAIVVPFAGHPFTVYPSLLIAFFVLLPAADLLTAHLLVQQFLAGGRLATLGLASAYLYSAVLTVPYAIAFGQIVRSGNDSIWATVCAPWLAVLLFGGFPVLAALLPRIAEALPERLNEKARNHRRAAEAVAAAVVLAIAGAATGLVVGLADRLPPMYLDGVSTTAGQRVITGALAAMALSLLLVITDLRRRPPVEQWVMVAIIACVIGMAMALVAPARFTLGWYAGRVALLASSVVVLLALIGETVGLYHRLTAAHEDLDQANRELNRRAEHLAAANLELEAAGTWKSDLLATLSHEINQPLAVISACSEELTQEWDSTTDDERHATVQALSGRVNQLLEMAAHLLTLSSAEPGDIRTRPVALPVDQALTRVVDNLTKQARKRVSAGPGPPAAAVWADPVHTHEVLTNFVTNAIKYSPGNINLSATLDNTGDNILLAVTDEGNGVPPDFVAHLFDRFTQADRPSPAQTGAGFGLYLCRLLAEANNGRVWYEDADPHGSRFILRLPHAPPTPVAETAQSLVDDTPAS
ncbi:sensor histidine kinase [Krasilnikovia sp. M28-CT-15]|uniref:sensor histidine kinase n=1 Tax=Krasilnikovia sp. M28-CT-15 TaxID=3373540 RepID=UPI0038776362